MQYSVIGRRLLADKISAYGLLCRAARPSPACSGFNKLSGADEETAGEARWTVGKSLAVLVGATVALTVEAEIVSGALEATAAGLGLSTFFLGITVLAVIGNAAEYLTAAYYARQDQMGVALQITLGATIQVAILIAPLLVLISYFMGSPMDLVFSPFEVVAVADQPLVQPGFSGGALVFR